MVLGRVFLRLINVITWYVIVWQSGMMWSVMLCGVEFHDIVLCCVEFCGMVWSAIYMV